MDHIEGKMAATRGECGEVPSSCSKEVTGMYTEGVNSGRISRIHKLKLCAE